MTNRQSTDGLDMSGNMRGAVRRREPFLDRVPLMIDLLSFIAESTSADRHRHRMRRPCVPAAQRAGT